MAIFAPSSTPGYSDPLKAMNIKALEKRQADLQAAMLKAEQEANSVQNLATPMQGFGYLANQAGDIFRERRAEAQIAAQREALARVRAGINPETGATPQQIANIGRYDMEAARQAEADAFRLREAVKERNQAKELQQGTQTFQAGENRLGREATAEQARLQRDTTVSEAEKGRQLTRDMATQEQAARAGLAQAERDFKGAQAELDRANATGDQQAKLAAQANLAEKQQAHETALANLNNAAKAALPASEQGKIASDADKGLLTPEERKAAMTSASAGTIKPKDLMEAKLKYTEHSRLASGLDRAEEYLKKGVAQGFWANPQTAISQALGVGDKELAQRTTDFKSIIEALATTRMSETLKGSSTDREMSKFLEIYNDPKRSPAEREASFRGLVNAMRADKNTYAESIKAYGGDTSRIDADMAAGAKGSGASASAPARPEGKDDATLRSEAEAFIKQYPNKAADVQKQLQLWGVK